MDHLKADEISLAYAIFEVKSVDTERRIIEGIATTRTDERDIDIVEPFGAKFRPEIPLLLEHDRSSPVGTTKLHSPTATGIGFTARIPKVDAPPALRDRVEEAWISVKEGLLRGVSVRLRAAKKGVELLMNGGMHFKEYEILELSLVSIPANSQATITAIKSFDAPHLAALGPDAVSHVPAGASAVSIRLAQKGARPMNTTERITQYEASRAAKDAARTAIQTKVGDEQRTKDEAERESFDTLSKEIDAIDRELTDLRMLETALKAAAIPADGKSAASASASRGNVVVEVKSNLPKGTAFTRYAMALAATKGSRMEAAQFAQRWEKSTPEVVQVLKAAVTAGTTTDSDWAAPLVVYQNMASEFIELLRPATIIGRIPGFRRVPFNITMPRLNSGSTVGWVGQGVAKPVGELSFDQVSLGMAKAAGIVVIAEELARSSNPSAEAVVSQDLREAITKFLDTQFIDPAVAAVTNVSPAAVTNGSTVIDSTGVTAAFFRADFASALAVWTAAGLSIAGGVVVMTETQAIRLSMIVNAFGQAEFPGISATGGSIFGLPVVTSENIPAEGGSPAGNRIVLLKPGEILLADDGGITIDVSREASVQMNSTPDNPLTASTVLTSLWQNNLVGIRAERFINWLKRRSAAAVVIEGAIYTG